MISCRVERIRAQWRKQESARDAEQGRSLDGSLDMAKGGGESREVKPPLTVAAGS